MTDELLKGLALQVINMAKTEMRWKHKLHGILAVYHEGQGLHRLRKIEKFAEEKAGPGWLNSGAAKSMIFGVMAAVAQTLKPTAVITAMVIDAYHELPAFGELPEKDRESIRRGERSLRAYPQYFHAHEAIMSLAQTPERVCMCQQQLAALPQSCHNAMLIGEPEFHFYDQMEGRLTMFASPASPELTGAIASILGRRGRVN